jgi:hypothetical protein
MRSALAAPASPSASLAIALPPQSCRNILPLKAFSLRCGGIWCEASTSWAKLDGSRQRADCNPWLAP